MAHRTTTAAGLDTGWSDAIDLVARLQAGRPLPRLQLGALAEGEHATLEGFATYAERSIGHPRGHDPAWVDESRADLVVTNRRILVGHPERGLLSLWHVDLEHLHLDQLPDERPHDDLPRDEERQHEPHQHEQRQHEQRQHEQRQHEPQPLLLDPELHRERRHHEGFGGEGGEWRLDLHPVGINPRVRLTGDAIPVVAVHLAHAAFPTTWSRLSGLLPLLEQAA